MTGRPFLQIPGPTLVPERIVRAMSQAMIDHRGQRFADLLSECLSGLKAVFNTRSSRILIFPASGTGAWESAIVNTLSPGDTVLACINGHFSARFAAVAEAHGLQCERLVASYGAAISAEAVEAKLREPGAQGIRAVLLVHNETSTGVTNDVAAVRKAMNNAGHQALLLVDTVSSLGSIDFRMDEWQVDVALTGSQKGLMLPPGMAILAVSDKAIRASKKARCPRFYWDWASVIERNELGEFPYTPATTLLFGLQEALTMLEEEGLPEVYARHERLAEAYRQGVRASGLKILCEDASAYSNTITAVCMPPGFDSGQYILHAGQTLQMSLGVGLGETKSRVFRIGHLGSLNEMDVLSGLAGVEMTLSSFGVNIPVGAAVHAAQEWLLNTATERHGRSGQD